MPAINIAPTPPLHPPPPTVLKLHKTLIPMWYEAGIEQHNTCWRDAFNPSNLPIQPECPPPPLTFCTSPLWVHSHRVQSGSGFASTSPAATWHAPRIAGKVGGLIDQISHVFTRHLPGDLCRCQIHRSEKKKTKKSISWELFGKQRLLRTFLLLRVYRLVDETIPAWRRRRKKDTLVFWCPYWMRARRRALCIRGNMVRSKDNLIRREKTTASICQTYSCFYSVISWCVFCCTHAV